MTVPLRKRVKRRVRSVLLVAAVRLLAFVPLRLALALGTAVGSVGWVLARRMRRQILAQLAIAFPERSDAEREAIGRASLLHLAWLAAEVMTLPHWRARLPDYVGLAPGVEEVFRGALARGRGVVYVAGHVGNWELMAQRVPRLGPFPAATIAKATIHPRPGDGHEVAAVEIPHDPDAPDREAEVIRLTAACSAVLEEAIRRNPAEWVWMHERWKSTPPEVSSGAAPQAKPVPKTAELSGG